MSKSFTFEELGLLASVIETIKGVTNAHPWQLSGGRKSRIYVKLQGFNGGENRRKDGAGRQIIVHHAGSVTWDERDDWAGAATRIWHQDNDTLAKVAAVVENPQALVRSRSPEPPCAAPDL